MVLCFLRIEPTLAAWEAAPQPPMPEHSSFQSVSVLPFGLTSTPFVCANEGIAKAKAASAANACFFIALFSMDVGGRSPHLHRSIGHRPVRCQPLECPRNATPLLMGICARDQPHLRGPARAVPSPAVFPGFEPRNGSRTQSTVASCLEVRQNRTSYNPLNRISEAGTPTSAGTAERPRPASARARPTTPRPSPARPPRDSVAPRDRARGETGFAHAASRRASRAPAGSPRSL